MLQQYRLACAKEIPAKRTRQNLSWFERLVKDQLWQQAIHGTLREDWLRQREAVLQGQVSPVTAAQAVFKPT